MTDTILHRTLWYIDEIERRTVDLHDLETDPRCFVVLGEAGMGKSTLLAELAKRPGHVLRTARALTNAADGGLVLEPGQTLIIDALDELVSRAEGDAVDLVVRKLGALGQPRFILSCRVADWRSATALQGLADSYGAPPVEIHLDPLDRAEAVSFLAGPLGPVSAESVIEGLETQGLHGLWSNPQTLGLVREVVAKGELPTSKGRLFAEATRLLRREHRPEKINSALAALPEAQVLDAAGAAFAALILTGREAISLRVPVAEEDLPLNEATALPRAQGLKDVLDSRLFEARGSDRFTYAHRAIGEFLAARWLARTADTARKRRRLLSLLMSGAHVPASLRGLFSWLAWHAPELADAVIATDPMALVQYGDTSNLTPPQGAKLLDALEALSRKDSAFRDWSRYRPVGLAQRPLLGRLAELISDKEAVFGLRLLILQALEGAPLVSDLAAPLEALVRRGGDAYALRSEAADRLSEADASCDWPDIIDVLREQGGEDDIRLAIEIIGHLGYDRFDDRRIAAVALAQIDVDSRTVGILHHLQTRLPVDRIEPLLDALADAARQRQDDGWEGRSKIADLVHGLLSRRMAAGPVAPDRLWSWLQPLDSHHGYNREARDAISAALTDDPDLRRAIQKRVLIDHPAEPTVWANYWRMTERASGLRVSEADVVTLLNGLDPTDPRWRDVVTLIHHNDEVGATIRAAAGRFAEQDADAQAWLSALRHPEVPQWQIDDERRRAAREAATARRWAEHRTELTREIAAVRKGEFRFIVNPAKAYLKLFADMGDEANDGPGRVEEWLGPDLRDAMLEGFEAFLTAEPVKPSAAEIAASHAENKHWEAAYVIVAALAERVRTERGFADLDDERLMAGYIEVQTTRIDDHAGVPELDRLLSDALRERGAWEATQRLTFEPQLALARDHVTGLYNLMRTEADAELARSLAAEWLERFPSMAATAEMELIDVLLKTAQGRSALTQIGQGRLADLDGLDIERRRLWTAVGLLIDFDTTRRMLGDPSFEPELLWHVRSRLGGRGAQRGLRLDAPQALWLVSGARPLFKMAYRPSGVTSGDANDWDASEFIIGVIRTLGGDASDAAIAAMDALHAQPDDGYSTVIQTARVEQKRKRAEADWAVPALADLLSVTEDAAPTTAVQLQAVILEELERVQRQIIGSDVDYRRDFLAEGKPKPEEDCRDALLKMLRSGLPFGIQAFPEGHLADDKRCDVVCVLGDLMVPIEIKGQWHRDLWTAADIQLDRLYVADWRAEVGIYLVLWFGASHPFKAPPADIVKPDGPVELAERLGELSATVRSGSVKVVVLDIERRR